VRETGTDPGAPCRSAGDSARIEAPEIDAIDPNRSPAHVIRSARSVQIVVCHRPTAHEPDQLAGATRSSPPAALPTLVTERHVLERDRRARSRRTAPPRRDLRLGVEHLEHACAEVVARLIVRAICPITSIGPLNIVV